MITMLPDNTRVEEPECSPYAPVRYRSLNEPVGTLPVPCMNCSAPAGPDAAAEPVSEQFIYAQPNFAMGYPTPDEPDQFGPSEPQVDPAGILVRPATMSTSVEPDNTMEDTFNSSTPLSVGPWPPSASAAPTTK